jgi:hypothetical protein
LKSNDSSTSKIPAVSDKIIPQNIFAKYQAEKISITPAQRTFTPPLRKSTHQTPQQKLPLTDSARR